MSILVSVVLPTRNGGEHLFEVLDALDAQRDVEPFEIVVVDDGSTDGTADRVRARQAARSPERTSRRPLRLLELAPGGPAVARNRGVEVAQGTRVAFLGDDTVPEPDWLARHLAAWQARGGGSEIAVIGYTNWHPRLRRTPFLNYLNDEGLQFGFALIRDRDDVPFNFFYTSNLSLDRARLLEEPFDAGFPYAAWEDIEAAYRLTRKGLRLVYESAARVAHDHPTDFSRFCVRQERAGYCAVVFWQRHPELGSFLGLSNQGPPPLPSAAIQRLREALVRALQFLPVSPRRVWYEALRFHYVRGLHRAWRERVVESGGVV